VGAAGCQVLAIDLLLLLLPDILQLLERHLPQSVKLIQRNVVNRCLQLAAGVFEKPDVP